MSQNNPISSASLIDRIKNAEASSESTRTILIQIRDVYGVSKAYPLNVRAKVLAEIAGTKTLTRAVLELAVLIGFTIKIESDVQNDWKRVQ
jgi:hypothetical protein